MISVTFSDIDSLMQVYDPSIVEKATQDTMRRLSKQVATQVSKAVRARYDIRAGEVKESLNIQLRFRGNSEALLVYRSRRLSLSRFATGKGQPSRSNRPKIKTRRGTRYGAKVRVIKGRPAKVVRGAFWGRARSGQGDAALGQGAWQIWKREGLARNSIRRLTGPGVAHMTRSDESIAAVNRTIDGQADKILASRLDFYSGRRAGVF